MGNKAAGPRGEVGWHPVDELLNEALEELELPEEAEVEAKRLTRQVYERGALLGQPPGLIVSSILLHVTRDLPPVAPGKVVSTTGVDHTETRKSYDRMRAELGIA